MIKSVFFLSLLVNLPSALLAQNLFESIGCGSGCNIEYFLVKGPLGGSDGLTKVLVRGVETNYGPDGSPFSRRTRQVWILSDCAAQTINMGSYTSNGQGADRVNWQRIRRQGTNYDTGVSRIFDKLCQ